MQITSMAFRTDMIFWRRDGVVADRGDYYLVSTPSNPTYFGGNLLLFERPPAEGDAPRWLAWFEREFGHTPEVRHKMFIWDVRESDPAPALGGFIEAGFEPPELRITLLTEGVHPPPKVNREIEVRTIETVEEWDVIVEAQVAARDARFEEELFRGYQTRRINSLRRLIEAGVGKWYGAFLGGKLVADMGIFRDGDVARFQSVQTMPEYRRRGICGTLVYEVSRRAFAEWGVKTLVMVADEGYHAAKIYESVGFEPKEKYSFVCLFPDYVRGSR